MRHPWGRCVALVTPLFLPFFASLFTTTLEVELFFEIPFFAQLFSVLVAPGIVVSIFLFSPITSLFGWSEHTDLTVLFFLGGIISIFFWATVIHWLYVFALKKHVRPVAVLSETKKKPARRKRKAAPKKKQPV